jgi:hypothetical protein
LCIGFDGTPAVAYELYDFDSLGYAVRTDSGWQHETLPWHTDGSVPCLAFDTACVPVILFVDRDTLYTTALLRTSRPAGSWLLDTIWHHSTIPGAEFGACDLLCDTRNPEFALARYGYIGMSWRDYLCVLADSGGRCICGGFENAVRGAVLGLSDAGRRCALFSNYEGGVDRLYYSDPDVTTLLDSAAAPTGVGLDTAMRPQVVYFKGGGMYFCWRPDSQWTRLLVPRTGVGSADLVVSDSCQPVIAFSDAQGVWLARGVDVVGVEDCPKPHSPTRGLGPTVLRNLPAGAVVFDAMGRRVLNPKPGVYFVRAVSGKPSAVSCHKVVIQR